MSSKQALAAATDCDIIYNEIPLPVCACCAGQRAPSTSKGSCSTAKHCQLSNPQHGYLRHPLQRFGVPKSPAFSSGIAAHVCSVCQLAWSEAAARRHCICLICPVSHLAGVWSFGAAQLNKGCALVWYSALHTLGFKCWCFRPCAAVYRASGACLVPGRVSTLGSLQSGLMWHGGRAGGCGPLAGSLPCTLDKPTHRASYLHSLAVLFLQGNP